MSAPRFWYTSPPTWCARVLGPLAWLYGQLAARHGTGREKRAYFAAVPVISVGNLVVGGAGKTPVVHWLAAHYAARGKQVAIISRGYGGSSIQPTRVDPHTHTAAEVGDEPLMLARLLAGASVHVWVGRNRPAVARRAEQAGASLLILDDGFQRRDVARDADILVIDGKIGFGNGLPLPAGPLREPPEARLRADLAIILNPPEGQPNYLGLRAYRLNSTLAAATLKKLGNKPLVAFAGLAHPEKFFDMLKKAGANVQEALPYPDHYAYTAEDMHHLQATARQHQAALVTTEKDATKLPQGMATAIPLSLTGPDTPDILEALDELLA